MNIYVFGKVLTFINIFIYTIYESYIRYICKSCGHHADSLTKPTNHFQTGINIYKYL